MWIMLGIPNCDTVAKARKFLEKKGKPFQFRDIRKQPLSADEWEQLVRQDTHERLVNTRSPSFRKTGALKSELTPEKKVEILQLQPTAMKRPVLLDQGRIGAIGFDESNYAQLTDG